jgi:acyl carrier protein
VRLDLQAVGRTMGGMVPPLWRSLVRAPVVRSRAGSPGTWSAHLATLAPAQRAAEVHAAVRAEVARVLSASTVPVDRPLSELGMDSMMAVELRNALGQRVGKVLPATLAFDYPTVEALTRWLLDEVLVVQPASPSLDASRLTDDEIRLAMASIPVAELRRTDILSQLLRLARLPEAARSEDARVATNIDEMGAEDLIHMFGIDDSFATREESYDE